MKNGWGLLIMFPCPIKVAHLVMPVVQTNAMLSTIILSYIVSVTFQACAINVFIPLTAPTNSSSISPSHISFSIEQDRWTDWPGATTKNEFVSNALNNLASLAGEPPRLRIGADSEDRTNFQPGLKVPTFMLPFLLSSLEKCPFCLASVD